MNTYSKSSQDKLNTTHPDLIILFQEVVRVFDNTILYGYRDSNFQFELYKKGRIQKNGIWIVSDKSKIVTYKDGIIQKSNHNYYPSRAVDVIPYPINWKDKERMYYFAGCVMGIAIQLKEDSKIMHNIRWGGDWDKDTEVKDETFLDLCHFEILI